MNDKILNACMFLAGAAVGSVVTWKLTKEKYKKIADKEISSVIAEFTKRNDKVEEVSPVDTDTTESERKEYRGLVDSLNYASHSQEETVNAPDHVYVIPPESVGEREDYEIVSLTYYADGVLIDELDEIVDDIDDMIGVDSLKHFGEYEDDSVHVRNDRLKIDFEILRDLRNYSDVVSITSHPVEDNQCTTE